MKAELKPIDSGKEHTATVILDENGFDTSGFPALLKTFVLNQWNNQQVNEDGKIQAHEVHILNHAYHKAEPGKYVLTIHWKFI